MNETHGQKETRNLKCDLTAEEVRSRAEQVADIVGKREEVERDKKSANDMHKNQIQTHDADIAELSKQVREKAEYRDVDCEWQRDEEFAKMELIRTDYR